MFRPTTAVRWIAALLLLAAARPAIAQTKTDVIRGRVIGQDTLPIANAQVAVVDSASDAKTPHIGRTDAKGEFSISIEGGGRYAIFATMLGHAPQRRTITRGADGTFAPLEFKLATVAAQLGAIRSVGERPKTSRSDINGDNSVGGQTSYISPNNGLIGDFTGDLTAALATIPGITIIPSATGDLPTISAFGITGGNSTVLNGIGFGGAVPRDGFRVAVVSSTYDPSKGGFAGVQTSVRMTAGSNLLYQTIHGTLDAPQLQWTTPIAQRLSTRYTQQIVSGTASGPIVLDHVFYSSSFQVQRRASGLTSLSNADPATLAALRISSDSVQRLFGILGPVGIPIRTSDVPAQRQNTEARGAVRFDWIPHPAIGSGPSLLASPEFIVLGGSNTQDTYYLQAGGTVRNNDGLMIGTTSIPSFGGQSTHRDGWTQFTAAKYLPKSVLNETTISVSGSVDHTDPYLDLPSARILVGSTLADGVGGLTTLTVGGNSQARTETRGWQTELRNQTSWNTWNRRHSIQLTLSGAEEGYVAMQDAGFGSYTYNSLADFASSAPASYSRTLTGRRGSGTALTGAVGLGDTYVTRAPQTGPGAFGPSAPPLTIQYGLRVEGNHFGSTPGYNSQVDSVFGLRTDHVPSTVAVMPMLGFRAYFLPPLKTQLGALFGPRLAVSGGVREYRGTIAARTLDSYARQTGLPDAIRQLYCVGDATPTANWQQFEASSGAIPTACADGTAGTALAQSTPPIALYSPDYSLFESWRPTMDASYQLTQSIRIGVNGTYTLNRGMPSFYDVNLSPATRFSLASEGGRPVYVTESSIVTATGATAWTESRVSPLFAHVAESRADLRGETRTLGGTISFFPFNLTPSPNSYSGSLGYTFSDSREQYRGFSSTDGDPTQVGWSRGSQARHALTITLRQSNKFGTLSMFGRLQSGAAYTPGVIGDINGDGYSNDRAYIFNPAATNDTSLANAMSRVLSTAPSGARSCLTRQIGTVAGRNSCVAPWAFTNLSLSIAPDAYRIGLGNRGSVSFFVNNILSGLDQAVHGSNKLHGWGQSSFPDPTLLTVRGFDPMKQQFVYTVNPQFGSTAVFRNTFRQPFMLTVDFRMEISPDRETQQLESALRPKKVDNVKLLSEAQIKSRIARGNDPVTQLVLLKDSLKLTDAQIDSMKKLSQKFMVTRDSIAGAVAHFLFLRNGDYGGAEVRDYWHSAGLAAYTAYFRSMQSVLSVFTPEQIARSKQIPQTIGLVTQLSSIKQSDIPWMFRFPFGSLP